MTWAEGSGADSNPKTAQRSLPIQFCSSGYQKLHPLCDYRVTVIHEILKTRPMISLWFMRVTLSKGAYPGDLDIFFDERSPFERPAAVLANHS